MLIQIQTTKILNINDFKNSKLIHCTNFFNFILSTSIFHRLLKCDCLFLVFPFIITDN